MKNILQDWFHFETEIDLPGVLSYSFTEFRHIRSKKFPRFHVFTIYLKVCNEYRILIFEFKNGKMLFKSIWCETVDSNSDSKPTFLFTDGLWYLQISKPSVYSYTTYFVLEITTGEVQRTATNFSSMAEIDCDTLITELDGHFFFKSYKIGVCKSDFTNMQICFKKETKLFHVSNFETLIPNIYLVSAIQKIEEFIFLFLYVKGSGTFTKPHLVILRMDNLWETERLLWIGHLKNSTNQCYLSTLPRELIRYICSYLWFIY
jgi:hypothetical protein